MKIENHGIYMRRRKLCVRKYRGLQRSCTDKKESATRMHVNSMASCGPTRQRWRIVWQTEALRYSSEQAASNLGVDKSTVNRMLLWNLRACVWPFGFCRCKNVANLCIYCGFGNLAKKRAWTVNRKNPY